jgi:hypothetical protein
LSAGIGNFSGELQGMPTDLVEQDFRTYFYVTRQGIDLHKADDTWWPLDDEGASRPGWKAPEL